MVAGAPDPMASFGPWAAARRASIGAVGDAVFLVSLGLRPRHRAGKVWRRYRRFATGGPANPSIRPHRSRLALLPWTRLLLASSLPEPTTKSSR